MLKRIFLLEENNFLLTCKSLDGIVKQLVIIGGVGHEKVGIDMLRLLEKWMSETNRSQLPNI